MWCLECRDPPLDPIFPLARQKRIDFVRSVMKFARALWEL